MPLGIGIGQSISLFGGSSGDGDGYALTAANNYVGSVGDSLTTAGGDMNGTVRFWNTSGSVGSYFTWAMALPATGVSGSEGKPIWAGASALSGQIISVIKATYWPAMRDATPKRGIVVFMAGSNDIGTISPGGVVDRTGRFSERLQAWPCGYFGESLPRDR